MGFIQFEIIINILVIFFCFISLPMLWVYAIINMVFLQYGDLIQTSQSEVYRRLMSVIALKGLTCKDADLDVFLSEFSGDMEHLRTMIHVRISHPESC